MSSYAEVVVLVEGQTEQRFVNELLTPYMAERGVYLIPILLTKPGQKGGDVKFSRAKNDIGKHLKQRRDTWITLMVDYYGIKPDWPGLDDSKQLAAHTGKAAVINKSTAAMVGKLFSGENPSERFIPYISMHEFEALLFSAPQLLATGLGVAHSDIEEIVNGCGEPEAINDDPDTAPSKRLKSLTSRFKKITTGIEIAQAIGIPRMRSACPLFNAWLERLESLVRSEYVEA